MDIAFATMPRSGSEFLIKMTRFVMNKEDWTDIYSLAPSREVGHHGKKYNKLKRLLAKGEDGISYFQQEDAQWVKFEFPGRDLLCFDVSVAYPEMKWLTSFRNIEDIILSHYNIKPWGWSERKILHAYVSDLTFYEYMASQNRLFVVHINRPESFELQRMMGFLEVDTPGERAEDIIRNWRVVNPLVEQQEKARKMESFGQRTRGVVKNWIAHPTSEHLLQKNRGDVGSRFTPPNLDSLRVRYPWLPSIEDRYNRLWENHR